MSKDRPQASRGRQGAVEPRLPALAGRDLRLAPLRRADRRGRPAAAAVPGPQRRRRRRGPVPAGDRRGDRGAGRAAWSRSSTSSSSAAWSSAARTPSDRRIRALYLTAQGPQAARARAQDRDGARGGADPGNERGRPQAPDRAAAEGRRRAGDRPRRPPGPQRARRRRVSSYADAMITPAISVLSAVEGVEVAAPSLSSIILPVTIGALALLFAIQRRGTAVVGSSRSARSSSPGSRSRARSARAGRLEIARNPAALRGTVAFLRCGVLCQPPADGVPVARCRSACFHRRGGSLRRYGALRTARDQPRLVLCRVPRA